MTENVYLTYYQKSKESIPAKTKEYYQKNKERLSAQAKEKYHCLSEEKKNNIKEYQRKYRSKHMTKDDKIKKRAYMKSWCAILSEDMKDKKREYTRNRYHTMIKVC